MIAREMMRRIEIKHEGQWVEADMGQVEPGDVFRMFEPGGKPVADSSGHTAWQAVARPFISGDWTIEVAQ